MDPRLTTAIIVVVGVPAAVIGYVFLVEQVLVGLEPLDRLLEEADDRGPVEVARVAEQDEVEPRLPRPGVGARGQQRLDGCRIERVGDRDGVGEGVRGEKLQRDRHISEGEIQVE